MAFKPKVSNDRVRMLVIVCGESIKGVGKIPVTIGNGNL